MKFFYIAFSALAFVACSSSGNQADTQNGEPFDAYKVNTADWVETDLGTTSTLVPVTVKLPKDAKLEKNGNGGVDVHLGDYYVITVSQVAVSSEKEAIDDAKSLSVNDKTYYKSGKVLMEEPNGFVYTLQPKDEANGFKYEPESHFFYVLSTPDQAFFTFRDNDAFGSMTPGSGYPEENAKKVYEIIKSSAKVNP